MYSLQPAVPQEIINLIIEEVASDMNRQDTLRTCCLVSRAFYPLSQKYLFSQIEFLVDGSANGRAARLVKVLSLHKHLLESIRSLKLILEVLPIVTLHGPRPSLWNKSRRWTTRTTRTVASRMKLWQNYTVHLLQVFADLPLENLAIEAQKNLSADILDWGKFCARQSEFLFEELVLQLTSIPTLRSITFGGISKIPSLFIPGSIKPTQLRHLMVYYTYFDLYNPDRLVRALANVTTLKLVDPWAPSAFLPLFWRGASPAHLLSQLTTVVVGLPINHRECVVLFHFLSDISRTIETLEFFDLDENECCYGVWIGPNFLGQFSALRQLNFRAKAPYSTTTFESKLGAIANLLTSATSPIRLSSIYIELHGYYGAPRSRGGLYSLFDRRDFRSYDAYLKWTGMDIGLTNPMFVNLATVSLNLTLIHYIKHWKPTVIVDNQVAQRLLPRLYDSYSIAYRVMYAETVCGAV